MIIFILAKFSFAQNFQISIVSQAQIEYDSFKVLDSITYAIIHVKLFLDYSRFVLFYQ